MDVHDALSREGGEEKGRGDGRRGERAARVMEYDQLFFDAAFRHLPRYEMRMDRRVACQNVM